MSIIIITIGAILLIVGIIYATIWNISFQQLLIKENTILNNIMINSSQSINASIYVSDLTRLLTLAIEHDNSMGILEAKIINPYKSIIMERKFSQDFIYSIQPKVKGMYTVIISNILTVPVTVNVLFGHFPINIQNNNIIDIESLSELTIQTIFIIVGIILIVSGIVIRIAFMVKET